MDTKKLRQKILDLAIRGKLVPQDPNDEPASVLLERIKAEKERLIKEGKIKKSKKSAKTSDTPHYQNVPFEIPDNWVSVPVSALFYLNPKSEIADNIHIGFIPMACVDDGFSGNHYFEKRIWKEVKKGYCHFQNGDIGIAKISPCFENLKSTIFQGLPNNCGAGTTELVILRPINIYAKFYLYLFKSQWYIDEGTKYFKGVVGQQRVHKGIFTDLHIPLPPLVEQQRIVTEIEKWFALIDQIEQGKVNLQTTIKQIKSKILDLAIHGKLVPQDPNDEPSIELLQRINPDFTPCDNGHYPFDVPNEWKWCKMNDLCSFLSRGKSPKYSEDDKTYPVFAQKCNLKEGGISLEQAKFLDPSTINKWDSKYKLQTGDVLVNSTGTGTVGRTRLFDESCLGKYPFVVPDSHVSVVRTYEEINSEYVFAYMSSQLIQQYIEDNLAGSTNQKELYIGVLENLYFPLPPIKEQQRIVQKIEKLFSILDNIQNAFRSVFVYTSKG